MFRREEQLPQRVFCPRTVAFLNGRSCAALNFSSHGTSVYFACRASQRFKAGKGCIHCRQTGFTGRDGIFEVMPFTEELKALVMKRANSLDLFQVARKQGMRTLRESGIEKVFRGKTTVGELVRVTGQ